MTDDELDLPECPVCGQKVISKTVSGPNTVILTPCGHHVSPEEVDDE